MFYLIPASRSRCCNDWGRFSTIAKIARPSGILPGLRQAETSHHVSRPHGHAASARTRSVPSTTTSSTAHGSAVAQPLPDLPSITLAFVPGSQGSSKFPSCSSLTVRCRYSGIFCDFVGWFSPIPTPKRMNCSTYPYGHDSNHLHRKARNTANCAFRRYGGKYRDSKPGRGQEIFGERSANQQGDAFLFGRKYSGEHASSALAHFPLDATSRSVCAPPPSLSSARGGKISR